MATTPNPQPQQEPQLPVFHNSGQMGLVPQSKYAETVTRPDYEPAVMMTAPDGTQGYVPRSRVKQSQQQGYIVGQFLPKTAGDKIVMDANGHRHIIEGANAPKFGPVKNFALNAAQAVYPSTRGPLEQAEYEAEQLYHHPGDTLAEAFREANPVRWVYESANKQGQRMAEDIHQGHYGEAASDLAYGAIPAVGPQLADAGRQMDSGDVSGGAGKAFGTVLPLALGNDEITGPAADAIKTTARAVVHPKETLIRTVPRAAGRAAAHVSDFAMDPNGTIAAAAKRVFGTEGKAGAPAASTATAPAVNLGEGEVIPPNVKRPGEVAPEEVGQQPAGNPNILARNQGVIVRGPRQLTSGESAPIRGALPEHTARAMPESADSSLEGTLQRRHIEATRGSLEEQGHAVRRFLRDNPDASPQQVREAVFDAIDKYGMPDAGLEPGESGVQPTTSVGRRVAGRREIGNARSDVVATARDLTPDRFASFPRQMSGESAATLWLSGQNLNTLEGIANARGLKFVRGGDLHASLIHKIVSNMSDRELAEFEAASMERSRFPRRSRSELKPLDVRISAPDKRPAVPLGGSQPQDDLTGLLTESINRSRQAKGLQPISSEIQNEQQPPVISGSANIEAEQPKPEPLGGKIRSTEEIMSDRQREVRADGIMQRAGLRLEGINRELNLATFSDPTSRSQKVATINLDRLLSEGPDAAKAEMEKVLSQPEPPRAGKGEKKPEAPAGGIARGISPAAQFQKGDTGFVSPQEIKLRPKEFQFKQNVNERGVTNQFVGNKFNEDLMGVVHVFKDPENGELAAVNGHHRVDLAQREGAPRLRIHVLETDNPARAKALGALQNIAEGNGTAYDAAVFLKQSKLTPADLQKMGVSLSAPKVEQGMALSRLDRSILDKVGTGEIPEGRAIAIGTATDDPATQEGILKLIAQEEAKGKTISDARVAEMARIAQSVGNYTEDTLSLFGPENRVNSLLSDVADISAFVKRELAGERSAFGAVASEGRAKKLGQVEGQQIKAKENAEISRQAAQALEVFDKLSVTKGPVNDLLVKAARRIRNGEKSQAVKAQAFREIRDEIQRALPGGQAGGRGDVQEGAESR